MKAVFTFAILALCATMEVVGQSSSTSAGSPGPSTTTAHGSATSAGGQGPTTSAGGPAPSTTTAHGSATSAGGQGPTTSAGSPAPSTTTAHGSATSAGGPGPSSTSAGGPAPSTTTAHGSATSAGGSGPSSTSAGGPGPSITTGHGPTIPAGGQGSTIPAGGPAGGQGSTTTPVRISMTTRSENDDIAIFRSKCAPWILSFQNSDKNFVNLLNGLLSAPVKRQGFFDDLRAVTADCTTADKFRGWCDRNFPPKLAATAPPATTPKPRKVAPVAGPAFIPD